MNSVIRIRLSKTGKHAGRFFTIVSDIDADLDSVSWQISSLNKKLSKRYAIRRTDIKGKSVNYHMHRIILERKIGRKLRKGEVVDHINGDGLDNRRENLRVATRSQNHGNEKKSKNNTSGYKGVRWDKHEQKYRAAIICRGKRYHLGCFDTPQDAHEAYCRKADELFGEYANYGEES